MTKKLLLTIFVFWPLAAAAESLEFGPKVKVTGAEIVSCGVIEETPPEAQQDEPQTVHGYVNQMGELETPVFKPGCGTVNAKIGTQFGIHVQVLGSPDMEVADLFTRWTHPFMRNPQTGTEGTVDEWASPMNIGLARYAGWVFEEPWELLPGKWKIEILHHNEVIAAKEFDVVVAETPAG